MEGRIKIEKYLVGGHGAFEKWWYRAYVYDEGGNYGVGFGAQRDVAVKKALKDLELGGRVPVDRGAVLGHDEQGRPTCHDKSGNEYVLRGSWVRSGKRV